MKYNDSEYIVVDVDVDVVVVVDDETSHKKVGWRRVGWGCYKHH